MNGLYRFVGAPFTLASYIVEGGSSKNYTHIKRLAFAQPDVLHALLSKLADNVADYVRYQVRSFCKGDSRDWKEKIRAAVREQDVNGRALVIGVLLLITRDLAITEGKWDPRMSSALARIDTEAHVASLEAENVNRD